MKVLVTGGAGFIGSHTVEKLIHNRIETVVVDNLSTGKEENLHPQCVFYKADITDPALNQIFSIEKPDFVIHLAAQIDVRHSLKDPIFDAHVNISGSIHLLQCCIRHHVKKIIYSSSAAVYGDPEYLGIDEKHPQHPMSFYGISKKTPEHYIQCFHQLYGLTYSILRYANVYGIRQDPKGEAGVISIFTDRLLNDDTVSIYGDGKQTRDFIYAGDVAEANFLALISGNNQIMNISSNKQTSVNELYSMISEILAKNRSPLYKLKRPGDIEFSCLDNSKAKAALGWEPKHTLYEGLVKTLDYYRHMHHLNFFNSRGAIIL